jgi:hypothetical protein
LETFALLKKKISFDIPYIPFWEFFENSSNFEIKLNDKNDKNSKKDLNNLKQKILNHVKKIKHSKIE